MAFVGQNIFNYEILSKLGRGGMGVVFRARDSKLDRIVALKFLSPDVSRDEAAKERFIQEAKAASAINHPNICSIHDIRETEDGQLFIVMALYEGQSLKHLLENGALDQTQALTITLQVAEGLAAAHEKGIVHRDIKPANIIVTEKGRAVILDFGIAKLTGGLDLTQTGITVGTTLYMSPEQARGDRVDHRSDIWSLGVVLAEAANGRLPFRGDYNEAVIYSILNGEPELSDNPEIALVNRVVRMALTKDPENRYKSAEQFISDLQSVVSGGDVAEVRQTTHMTRRGMILTSIVASVLLLLLLVLFLIPDRASSINSLAVLPLTNLSGEADQEFLADGMTDVLINELSKIGAIKVISRQSVMRFKNSDLSLPEIAANLNVDAVVSGSIIRSDDDIRVSAQMVSARSEDNIWANSFDEKFENVLILHSTVAVEIAHQIQVSLTPQEQALLTQTRTVDPRAYEAYLRGDHHMYKLSQADTETAIDYFERSLAIDSTYAEAHAGIATAWMVLQQMGAVSPAEAGPLIMGSLEKATMLDSTLAEVHYTQAVIQAWGLWDFAAAEVSFRRAIELNPNYAEAYAFLAHLLNIVRKGGGIESSERSIDLDPYNSLFQSLYGASLTHNRRFGDAMVQARISQESAPRNFVNFEVLTICNEAIGQPDEAYAIQIARWAMADDTDALAVLREGYESGGFPGAAGSLAELLAERSKTQYVSPNQVSGYYLWAGDTDRALEWLERGFEMRDPAMAYIGFLSYYDSLRGDARFDDLLRRMNLGMWID